MPVGIDTNLFKKRDEISKIPRSILFLGRISPIKKPHLLVDALSELKKRGVQFSASFFGDALPKDVEYKKSLEDKLKEYDIADDVEFRDGVANEKTIDIYNQHEVFVNLTTSGSYDKTIFESMACETMVAASNKDLHGLVKENFIFKEDDVNDLSEKLEKLLALTTQEKEEYGRKLRQIVVEKHSLQELAVKLFHHIE
jgi:glycosyltransferase involved in cell wall biosynthesis